VYQGNGNYASIVTINGERFDIEDGWGDEKKMYEKIEEIRNND
jgi:hypothetical protein